MARMQKIILGVCCAILVAGCASDRKAPTLNQALGVLTSPTTRSVASIARSDNAKEAIKQGLKSRESVYKSNPYALVQDVKSIKRDYNNLVQTFPSLVTARLFGFAPAEFFEIETATERQAPEVKL